MATCPNCKKNLSCGCQKRTASDGSVVCTNCISTYERKTVKQKLNYNGAPKAPLTEWSPEQLEASKNSWNNFKKKFTR